MGPGFFWESWAGVNTPSPNRLLNAFFLNIIAFFVHLVCSLLFGGGGLPIQWAMGTAMCPDDVIVFAISETWIPCRFEEEWSTVGCNGDVVYQQKFWIG